MELGKMKKTGIWFLTFALFVAHLFFRTAAHANEGTVSPWRQMEAKHGECQIAFPVDPQLIEQKVPLANSPHHLSYDVYLAPFEDRGVFLLLVATYPLPVPGGQEVAGLQGLVKGIVSHHADNRLVYAQMVEFANRPAVNFLVESGKSYFRGHAVMVGNRLFLVAMEGRAGDMDEKTFNRFLKSFKIQN